MRLWEFEEILQGVQGFTKPKVMLEQYITSPHIAASMLFTADQTYGDIGGKRVLDLGCGTGMLSIGASCLDALTITAVDIDEDAISIAQENAVEIECDIDFIQCDIHTFDKIMQQRGLGDGKYFETVIMV
jgi:predicted RNA methylase